jgi:hypothetical protein
MSEIIYLSNVRVSFPQLAEPKKTTNEKGEVRTAWSADLIMPADSPVFKQFMQQYMTLATEKWKERAQTIMQMIQNDRKSRCYGMGTEKINKTTLLPYDGYDGNAYISAISNRQPQMIQPNGSPVDASNSMAYQAIARSIYGGCYVNAAVRPWLQENTHGRGVRCDLVAIQFAKDGDAFGGGSIDLTGVFGAVSAAPAAPAAAMPAAPFPAVPGMPSFM